MLIRLLPIGHQGALWADLALDIRRAGIWERGTSLGFHTMTADTDRRIGQADDNVMACQAWWSISTPGAISQETRGFDTVDDNSPERKTQRADKIKSCGVRK